MARVALVVTNACAPDPRVERHALWLSELGHEIEIHAWDREHNHLTVEEKMDIQSIDTKSEKQTTQIH